MKLFKTYVVIFIYIFNVHNIALHASLSGTSLLSQKLNSFKNVPNPFLFASQKKSGSQYSCLENEDSDTESPLVALFTNHVDDNPKTPKIFNVPQGNIAYESQIRKALLRDDAAAIQKISKIEWGSSKKKFIDFNQPLDRQGTTIVHKAVYNNAINILTFLITNKLPVIPQPEKPKESPSYFNLFNDNSHDTALKHKKKPTNIIQTASNTIDSCKKQAINYTNNLIDSVMHKTINLDAQDENGWTALHVATILHRSDMIQLLIKNKADVNIQDNDGYTAAQLEMLHAPGKRIKSCTAKAHTNRGRYSDEEFKEIRN